MEMHYKPTTWVDVDWKIRMSPIGEEAKRWIESLKSDIIKGYKSLCLICGEYKYNGLHDQLSGRFRCQECLMQMKMDQLANDPKWIKLDRAFNMRHAREQHKLMAEARRSVDAAIEREALREKEPFKIGGVYENCI